MFYRFRRFSEGDANQTVPKVIRRFRRLPQGSTNRRSGAFRRMTTNHCRIGSKIGVWVDGNDSNMESNSIMVPGTGSERKIWKH